MLHLHIIEFGGNHSDIPVRDSWGASKILLAMVEANQITIRQAFLTRHGKAVKQMEVC